MFYIPRPCDIQPGPLAWHSSLNFLVQESHEMRPREIFMHRMAIGWVFMEGAIVMERKYSTSTRRKSSPRLLVLQAIKHSTNCKLASSVDNL